MFSMGMKNLPSTSNNNLFLQLPGMNVRLKTILRLFPKVAVVGITGEATAGGGMGGIATGAAIRTAGRAREGKTALYAPPSF